MFILQKIPTQNNLREDEIRGATSIIGFLLSLIPVSDSSCNRLCDKGHSLENYEFFSRLRWTQPYSFLCLFSATTSSLREKSLYLFHLLFFSFKIVCNSSYVLVSTTRDINDDNLIFTKFWCSFDCFCDSMGAFNSWDNSFSLAK